MFSDIANTKDTAYSIKSDFSTDGKVISVLNFLEEFLPMFPEKFIQNKEDDEWILNQELFSCLQFHVRDYAFQLITDYIGKNKSKPDFGVREKGAFYDRQAKHLLDIECKRLYDKEKSKQYVSTTTGGGGIQRFKEGKHGVDLLHSAMIGYVENENFLFWHDKVNSWIEDKTEHLCIITDDKMAKLKSTHKRHLPKKTPIELTHFWLKMNFGEN